MLLEQKILYGLTSFKFKIIDFLLGLDSHMRQHFPVSYFLCATIKWKQIV